MTSQTKEQISTLPAPRKLVTGHNQAGKAEFIETTGFKWSHHDEGNMAFSVAYTTSTSPPNLTNDADLKAHDATLQGSLGLVNPRGSVLRCVDIAPGHVSAMHRTRSLDYGIIIEGEVDLILDDGVKERMKRGDVAVQRATIHQWTNPSKTEWARVMFVLQDCEAGVDEELGKGTWLPPSGN